MEIVLFILCILSETNFITEPIIEFIENNTPDNTYKHIALNDLLLSISTNDVVANIVDKPTVDLKSDQIFNINQRRDTIIIKIINSQSISIISSSDSLCLSYDPENKVYIKRHNRTALPFYEKELALKWDIDSLDILCLYNREVYDHIQYVNLYRFIIDHGEFVREHKSFSTYPELPDEFVDGKELALRQIDRHNLYLENKNEYKRLFGKRKNETILNKFIQRLFKSKKTS